MRFVNQTPNCKARRRKKQNVSAAPSVCYSTLICLGFALAACDNSDRLTQANASKIVPRAEVFLTPMQSEGLQYVATYGKQLQASAEALVRVKKAMEAYLFDPATAQYHGLRSGRNGAVCGKYNGKNRYGAFVGFKDFVMSGDGQVHFSDTSGGLEASSNDDYVKAYLDACATKGQIAAHESWATVPSTPASTDDSDPIAQEPDRILDAPTPRKRRATPPVVIPTA